MERIQDEGKDPRWLERIQDEWKGSKMNGKDPRWRKGSKVIGKDSRWIERLKDEWKGFKMIGKDPGWMERIQDEGPMRPIPLKPSNLKYFIYPIFKD